jgi:putative ABC transport system ATP-binding protein
VTNPVFHLDDLRKTYGMGEAAVHALRGVDLDVDEGELLVLLGPSGSGKSTLLNILGGLDRPTGGVARFRDLDLAAAPDAEITQYRRTHVGFVFQFYNLIASLTATENVELVTEIAPSPLPAAGALRLVGLGERLAHFPAQLSGGEQQRVAIARAIAKRPTVLLCDEPTGALDVATGVRVLESLVDVNVKLGTTTLLITHNADIARIGDRVVRFADGHIRDTQRNATRVPPRNLEW